MQPGDSGPGWDILPRTLNKSLREVGNARMTQNLLDRFGLRHNFHGQPLTQNNIQDAIHEYETAHGIETHEVARARPREVLRQCEPKRVGGGA